MNRTLALRLALAGVLAVGLAIPLIRACAPEGPTLAFTWDTHPDLPLNAYAAGRLGVLQPTYARSYLVVAYRYLEGRPLTREEQQGALELWDQRLRGGVRWPKGKAAPAAGEPAPDWQATRAQFTREKAPAYREDQWIHNTFLVHVTPEAQAVAARTLLDRAKRWPPSLVQAWIRAQDQVFAADAQTRLPPTPAGADALFAKDHAYQAASVLFYQGNLADARQAYAAIGQDPASPWRRVAAYLVGRCSVRQAQLEEDPDRVAASYRGAYRVFHGLREGGLPGRPECAAPEPVADADLNEAIAFWEYKALAESEPERAAELLVPGLLGRSRAQDFGDLLGRFTYLLDRTIRGEEDRANEPRKGRRIEAGMLKQDLVDWVYQFRETGPAAFKTAYQRWQARPRLPWLVMALANAEPSSKGVEALLAAAAQVPEAQAGYETVAFHRARLLAAMGKAAEAQALMGPFLDDAGKRATPSSLNLWRALRMPLSQDPKAFLADALRVPAGSYGFGEADPAASRAGLATHDAGLQAGHPQVRKLLRQVQAPAQFIQGDAAKVLNLRMPTEGLVDLANQPGLPDHLRREWLRAAWVRAVLLERWDLAAQVMPAVLAADPELKPGLERFAQAPAEEQARLALLAIAAHPGLRWMVYQGINHRTFTEPGEKALPLRHRDTFLGACWWPGAKWAKDDHSDAPVETYLWGSLFYYPRAHARETPLAALGPAQAGLPWLTADQRSRGEAEGRRLLALPDAPDWIGERVLAWAQRDPGDPRIPEALHWAVLAGKVGGEKGLGTTCFKLLHSRYRTSPWAAKTPIHY